jgi:diketogulonate reductase-like aldo/keto reductase
VPRFFYGTAWKEQETLGLTRLALAAGFRAIDTANQRRHYVEAAVGEAVGEALGSALVTRGQLFLQSKFTFMDGQDHRLPYDPKADIATQVAQSFARSLEHFGTPYLDSYLLHGPSTRRGLGSDDWQAWRAMEALAGAGAARFLGVSNVSLEQLEILVSGAEVPPAFVQNRCYARSGWDERVRSFCREHGILYQGFSLLTANRRELASRALGRIARDAGVTPEQVVFRFALEVGMLPLTGTSRSEHMRLDLGCFDLSLDTRQVDIIKRIATLD